MKTLLLLTVSATIASVYGRVDVVTTLGPVFGTEEVTDKVTFHTFRGIPYAEPPVDHLRFKDPVPKRPWNEPLNATQDGSDCLQQNDFLAPGELKGSEDCLFINVNTPKDRKGLLPVMVFIHGGGFVFGSGSGASAELFMEKDVVAVSLNYRLGPFGFLNLGDEHIAGNMGLKDQLLALQWVNANIHAFGGDESKVTIFGESAGAISASLLQVSPLGNGLFQNVIAMSGDALMRSSTFAIHKAETLGQAFLEDTECSNKASPVDIVECLQELNSTQIAAIDQALRLYNNSFPMLDDKWWPSLDSHSSNPILPEHPLAVLTQGKQKNVNFMTGIVEDEGALSLAFMLPKLGEFNENWKDLGPQMLFAVTAEETTAEQRKIALAMRHFYNGLSTNFTLANKDSFSTMTSDIFFLAPLMKNLQLQAARQSGNKLYMYENVANVTAGLAQVFDKDAPPSTKLGHGDDLFLIFTGMLGLDGLQSKEAKKASDVILTLFTNFAKFGDPTPEGSELPEWKEYQSDEENYYVISDEPELKKDFAPERSYFFDSIFWPQISELMMR